MNKRTFSQFLLAVFAFSICVLVVAAQSKTTETDAELKRLQGYWEGEGAGGKCSITITGNTLLYRVRKDWFKTTFILPERKGAELPQLHATIIDCSPPTNSIGQVIPAIFKIELGTLTLSAFIIDEKPPENFDSEENRYIVIKAQAPEDPPQPSDIKPRR